MPAPRKSDKLHPAENKAQTAFPTKKDIENKEKSFEPPIDTPITDNVQNSADQTPGLNQAQIIDNDPLPLD